jgi:transposase
LVAATGSGLMTLNGVGPSGAARLLGDVGDIARFPTKAHFASWNGTAPIDASSGDQQRHRLSRAGNRRINRVLHIMAIVQLRHDTEGRAYFRRKVAAGKTSMEAMRALKRRLSDAVYRQMTGDAEAAAAVNSEAVKVADPGGQAGASTGSSAADSHPDIDTSERSLRGPATTNLRRPPRPLKTVS